MIKWVVKYWMKKFPSIPNEDDYSLWEIFKQKRYIEGTITTQNEIKMKSAEFRYDYESKNCFFDMYFPNIPKEDLKGKCVLDCGCFTGGRLVYWKERYKFGDAKGIDINPIFEETANLFSKEKGLNIEFKTGFGENLPFPSNSFDYVISYDVFEHVQSVEKVMDECFRVLKDHGKLLVVFPQYLQPFASHLGFVTKLHGLHLFFSGKVIAKAAYEIHAERGPKAEWYAFESPNLKDWEKLPELNGISIVKFKKLLKKNTWKIIYQDKRLIFLGGKRGRSFPFKYIKMFCIMLTMIPYFKEILLSRVCYILEKNENKGDEE